MSSALASQLDVLAVSRPWAFLAAAFSFARFSFAALAFAAFWAFCSALAAATAANGAATAGLPWPLAANSSLAFGKT